MVECEDSFLELCKDVKIIFDDSDKIISTGRNIIKLIDFNDKTYSIKRFKIPNIVNRFAYRYIRDSKAKRSYKNAKKLEELKIFNPKAIGYVEEFTPLLSNSYYICEYFDFDFEIRDVLKHDEFNDREKILKEFVKFSYKLHEKGVYHIDYSPGNVLIKLLNDGYQFALVDLNRMKFINFTDELRFKNLSRFSATNEDTLFIAKEYANISKIDENFSIDRLFYYHKKHQQYLENKRKMKALKLK